MPTPPTPPRPPQPTGAPTPPHIAPGPAPARPAGPPRLWQSHRQRRRPARLQPSSRALPRSPMASWTAARSRPRAPSTCCCAMARPGMASGCSRWTAGVCCWRCRSRVGCCCPSMPSMPTCSAGLAEASTSRGSLSVQAWPTRAGWSDALRCVSQEGCRHECGRCPAVSSVCGLTAQGTAIGGVSTGSSVRMEPADRPGARKGLLACHWCRVGSTCERWRGT